MDLNLSKRRALVCGSSQGIGKAIAIELAELGASVTLMARNQERLESVLGELNTSSGQHHEILIADFSNESQVEQVINQYVAMDKFAEILINNTGGPPGGPAIDANLDEFLVAFKAHLICNQILTQALVPGMKTAGYGRIINVISTSVKQPIHGLGVSNTIRGAVANWSKTLASELGPFGITVNNVLPGATKTARLDSIIANKAQKSGQSIDDVTAAMENGAPAKRICDPSEVAAAAAFLASPAASFINGINLPVDGGRTQSL